MVGRTSPKRKLFVPAGKGKTCYIKEQKSDKKKKKEGTFDKNENKLAKVSVFLQKFMRKKLRGIFG